MAGNIASDMFGGDNLSDGRNGRTNRLVCDYVHLKYLKHLFIANISHTLSIDFNLMAYLQEAETF